MNESQPKPLDYEPPPPGAGRARARRRWIVFGCYAGLALLTAFVVYAGESYGENPLGAIVIVIGLVVMLWELYDWAGEATGRW